MQITDPIKRKNRYFQPNNHEKVVYEIDFVVQYPPTKCAIEQYSALCANGDIISASKTPNGIFVCRQKCDGWETRAADCFFWILKRIFEENA